MRMPISEEPSIIFSYNSVPSMSVNTLAAFSRSACVASGFLAVLQASSISSKLLPEARGVSEASSSGSSSPYPSSSGGMLVKVSSSFSSGTCAGRDAFPVFPSSKVASSSDSSMPFSIVAASCVGMAAVVRVDAILKRLLPMMSAFSAGTSSCAAMRLASFPSSDRHNPTMPLKKRTIRVSMMRS